MKITGSAFYSGQLTIEKHSHFGKYLSLIPLTPEISGLTLRGVKYPLEDHRVLQGGKLMCQQ